VISGSQSSAISNGVNWQRTSLKCILFRTPTEVSGNRWSVTQRFECLSNHRAAEKVMNYHASAFIHSAVHNTDMTVPSIARRYCVKAAKRIVDILSLPDRGIILVFLWSVSLENSDGVTSRLTKASKRFIGFQSRVRGWQISNPDQPSSINWLYRAVGELYILPSGFLCWNSLPTWVSWSVTVCQFLRATAYAIARMILPVRPSHGWISQKRLKLGSQNFYHTVAPSL